MMKKAVVLFAVLAAVVLGCSNPSGGGGGRPPPDLWDGNPASSFAGGNGTEETPYIISTAAQLAYLAQQVNGGEAYAGAHFILTRDLNLDFDLDSNTREWTAIGTDADRFKGKFDGGGHVIYRLGINKSGDNFQGLFGYLDGAEISNLGLEGVTITGKNYVGGIAGRVDSGSISGSYSTGAVNGSWEVGGIAGSVYDGSISGSYSTGAVSGTGSAAVGGIAGSVGDSSIANSYSTGTVRGPGYYTGGIAGFVSDGSISGSYSTGTVSGANRVGGIAGRVNSGSIKNCAALNPSVTATSDAGRVAASIYGTFTNNNFAWDGMGTGGGVGFITIEANHGTGITTAQVKDGSGFPFDVNADPWTYTTGRLPVLKGLAGQSNALPEHLR
jgi:hypothetical protein